MNNQNINKNMSKLMKSRSLQSINNTINDLKRKGLPERKDPNSTIKKKISPSKHSLQLSLKNYFKNPTKRSIEKDLINSRLKEMV